MSIQIDKHIPMPSRTKIPPLPFSDMEIGDSFKAPIDASSTAEVRAMRQRIVRWQRTSTSRFSCVSDKDEESGQRIMRVFRVA